MGQYVKGDVLLASVALDDRTAPKIRPVVVILTEEPGRIHILPGQQQAAVRCAQPATLHRRFCYRGSRHL